MVPLDASRLFLPSSRHKHTAPRRRIWQAAQCQHSATVNKWADLKDGVWSFSQLFNESTRSHTEELCIQALYARHITVVFTTARGENAELRRTPAHKNLGLGGRNMAQSHSKIRLALLLHQASFNLTACSMHAHRTGARTTLLYHRKVFSLFF